MSDARGLVVFDHVWKKFHRGEVHDSLRDLIPAVARRIMGKGPPRAELHEGDFWALRDVSFEVKPGEALGIIGSNGAGKSTILKTLTKILRPTRGSCAVHGRVGALIEIAAGFHQDLTGRENVFLQGAIMGMRRREIEASFDEIVEFSEISEFIDTPVKRYSSGMNARLGFSIAAHLNPDVLIVDEVLAVGDMRFQQKAFDRIRQLVRRDIPVVVVSHQLDRIASLCTKAIVMEKGRVTAQGTAREAIASYLRNTTAVTESEESPTSATVTSVELAAPDGAVPSGEAAEFVLTGVMAGKSMQRQELVGIRVRSLETGMQIYAKSIPELDVSSAKEGRFTAKVILHMNVTPGLYCVEGFVRNKTWDWWLEGRGAAAYVQVSDSSTFYGSVQLNLLVEGATVEGVARMSA
jgi:ABC-type polysaccharide/polyol phosphate transport system ATPase subunit